MDSINILVICVAKIPSVIVMILEVLRHCGEGINVRFLCSSDIKKTHIAWCDVLISVRGCESVDKEVVKAAKRADRLLIFALDDDLLDIPPEVPCAKYFQNPELRENIIDIMNMCDVFWTTSPNLLSKYQSHFTRSLLMDACVQLPEKYTTISELLPIKFLYAGSTDHSDLIKEVLYPPIKKILDEYGAQVHFTFIGADPGLSDEVYVKYIPYINDYDTYRKTVIEGGYHAAFAVVRDESFYRCKYYNKFLEYTSIGAVGLYSALEPYTFLVKNELNGLLCETEEQWYQAMRIIIENPAHREQMLQLATSQLNGELSPRAIANQLKQKLPELFSFHAPKILPQQVRLSKNLVVFYLLKVKMLFLEHGIKAIFLLPLKVCKIIKKCIKSMVSYSFKKE